MPALFISEHSSKSLHSAAAIQHAMYMHHRVKVTHESVATTCQLQALNFLLRSRQLAHTKYTATRETAFYRMVHLYAAMQHRQHQRHTL